MQFSWSWKGSSRKVTAEQKLLQSFFFSVWLKLLPQRPHCLLLLLGQRGGQGWWLIQLGSVASSPWCWQGQRARLGAGEPLMRNFLIRKETSTPPRSHISTSFRHAVKGKAEEKKPNKVLGCSKITFYHLQKQIQPDESNFSGLRLENLTGCHRWTETSVRRRSHCPKKFHKSSMASCFCQHY